MLTGGRRAGWIDRYLRKEIKLMKRIITRTLLTGLMIAAMSTTPIMAYTNDAAPFEFTTSANVDIHVGDNADLIIAHLGEPNYSGKVGKGDEAWYYAYNCYTIYTSKPSKGKETVAGITINGSGATTREGLGVGATKSDMITRYGNKGDSKYSKSTDLTTYTYKKGGSFLDILINCYNKVTSIYYR